MDFTSFPLIPCFWSCFQDPGLDSASHLIVPCLLNASDLCQSLSLSLSFITWTLWISIGQLCRMSLKLDLAHDSSWLEWGYAQLKRMAQRYQNRVSGDTGDVNLSQLVKVVFYCKSNILPLKLPSTLGEIRWVHLMPSFCHPGFFLCSLTCYFSFPLDTYLLCDTTRCSRPTLWFSYSHLEINPFSKGFYLFYWK